MHVLQMLYMVLYKLLLLLFVSKQLCFLVKYTKLWKEDNHVM